MGLVAIGAFVVGLTLLAGGFGGRGDGRRCGWSLESTGDVLEGGGV